jgi:hypothetical protein
MEVRLFASIPHRASSALAAHAPPLGPGGRLALAAFGVLALTACAGSSSHELGSTHEGPAPAIPFLTKGEGFVGRWLGQAREPLAYGLGSDQEAPAYVFPSGSSRILLTIEKRAHSDDAAGLGGSLTFGEGQPPPRATDGELGYPEGFDYVSYLSYTEPTDVIVNYDEGLPPLEGFGYEVESSSFDDGVPDGVLRMKYEPWSYLDSWCSLQVPHEQPDGTYGALPFAAGGTEQPAADGRNRACAAFGADDLSACPADMAELPVNEYLATYAACYKRGPVVYHMSCDRIFLTHFCSCTANSCGVGAESASSLMLRSAGSSLIGVFDDATFLNARGLATPIGEVRFRRVDD